MTTSPANFMSHMRQGMGHTWFRCATGMLLGVVRIPGRTMIFRQAKAVLKSPLFQSLCSFDLSAYIHFIFSFATYAPSTPSANGSNWRSVSSLKLVLAARNFVTTSVFSSGSRLQVL